MPNTAVLWTGGKDCALAMHRAMRQGANITQIVTFVPPDACFHAHPLGVMQAQVDAIGKPWRRPEIREPYFESYREALTSLKRDYGVGAVATGDITLVDGCPNWIRQCAEGLDIEVLTPLWEEDRVSILRELVTDGFEVMISAVRPANMDEGWLGRIIDEAAISELESLEGVDPCGENGEFHTVVLNAPYFGAPLVIDIAGIHRADNMVFADIRPRRV